ncbi:unnamed protein product [Cuscuta epithymum]|uniref:Leucine-rich repeat-containing N-terminal plant-type domain-containing protein n=1 Tax=Cuscuta epithymum TaxID=186058 RepID=A0AAV0CH25_9ASTE|nr:unnamed protein product [Cuscuta epithymum]
MRMAQRRLSAVLLYWVYTCASLLLFCFFLQIPLVSSNAEGDALVDDLKNSISDPNNCLQSWNPTLTTPCTWFHISCNSNNYVTRIDLGGCGLAGSLPSNLGGELPNLEVITLNNNNLTGSIPESFGNFPNLKELDVSNNNLEGNIPTSLLNRGPSFKLNYTNNPNLVVPSQYPSPTPVISGSNYMSFGWTIIITSLSLVWVMANTLFEHCIGSS